MITLQATSDYGNPAISVCVESPSICPICHHAVQAVNFWGAFYETGLFSGVGFRPDLILPVDLQVVFRCSRRECHRLFIMRFRRACKRGDPSELGYWEPQAIQPQACIAREFAPEIGRTSPRFIEIYRQAAKAEDGLDQLCGTGYRKALEFLIKDYVKTLPENTDKEEAIEKCQLSPCISNFVRDTSVELCASRATWLGNDETHYIKKWPDKDLSDLKKLIDLTLHWISADILTRELELSMPPKLENPPKPTAPAAEQVAEAPPLEDLLVAK